GPPCGCPDPSRHVRSDGRWCGPRARPARGARPGTYVVLALLVVLLRARIISLASGTPRNRGQLTPVLKWDTGVEQALVRVFARPALGAVHPLGLRHAA